MKKGLLLLTVLMLVALIWAANTPEYYYKKYQPSLYQVQLIDVQSNEKAVIGTGFKVSDDGKIITNYHVVSEYIFYPQDYTIVALTQDGVRDTLQLLSFDVLHDCAVLQSSLTGPPVLPLAASYPAHGERMYAIGNPYDLGMTIVEGNFNSLVEKSFYDKMHFSGSLNPGMSGGPAINKQGQVVGVNVSTGGEQISFIVPVSYVRDLLQVAPFDSLGETVFQKRIEDQLIANQSTLMQRYLNSQWPVTEFGPITAPEAIGDEFSAGGFSDTDGDRTYVYHNKYYSMNDNVYVADGFQLGDMEYSYRWYEADGLNADQFAMLLAYRSSSLSSGDYWFFSDDDEVDTATMSSYVTTGGTTWKVLLGFTNLLDYPSLYKLSMNMVSADDSEEGVIIKLRINGVTKENGTAMMKKFMEHITWNK
jgi:hypothetical protein